MPGRITLSINTLSHILQRLERCPLEQMDKVKKICEALTKETLDPAKKQAQEIINSAKKEADEIVEAARRNAENIFDEGRKKLIQERSAQETSLNLAAKKSIDKLRHAIENELFAKAWDEAVSNTLKDHNLVAKIIESMTIAIEKEGIDTDLQLVLDQADIKSDLSKFVKAEIWEKVQKGGIVLSHIKGGAQIKITGKALTLDMSHDAIVSLLASFVRDEIRSLILSHA